MKYKTTIHILTEADDKNEATEIAGEYLSGNIISGVEMKCYTKPLRDYRRYATGFTAVALIIFLGFLSMVNVKNSKITASVMPGMNAIQPPLQTSVADRDNANFKKEWQAKQVKEVLGRVRH